MATEDLTLSISVDGEQFTMDDLTYRERKEMRRLARELDGTPGVDLEEILVDDLVLAFATVCKRRNNPEFSIDDALDIRAGDLLGIPATAAASSAKARPTQARAKAGAKSTP